jgi:2-oxoisovalerate dehydrogenase E1 component
MTRDLHGTDDKGWAGTFPKSGKIGLGEFGVFGESREFTIATYGNGYYLSRQAAKILEDKHGIKTKIIDLRWLAPLNKEALLKEIGDCPHLMIVDECRKTGSWSEWLCEALLETCEKPPRVKVVAADDCFIPLGKAAAAGLPSRDEIVNEALRLLNKV